MSWSGYGMKHEKVLIDTSAWLFALRKDYVPEIRDRVDYLLKENQIVTTGIVKLELLAGTKSKLEYTRLKNRFSSFESIETDNMLWEKTYEIGFTLRRKGVTIPFTDILIAACALSGECVLMHAHRHFEMAAKHFQLKTESYVEVVTRQNR
jgi:predicted nucleic acid-binding protein